MDRTVTINKMYTYTDPTWSTVDLTGFKVEATDGELGSIDETTYQIGTDALVCDTGPWIFGQKVLLPVGVVSRVDVDGHRVFVNCTKEQIKNAPEFHESRWNDHTYRDELGTYYETHVANRPAGPDFGKDDRSAF